MAFVTNIGDRENLDRASGGIGGQASFAKSREGGTGARTAKLEAMARGRREVAVADLSERALAVRDLGSLLNDAALTVTKILKVHFCNILELTPAGNMLRFRAGAGWKESWLGKMMPAGRGSQAEFTLLSDRPVIIKDFRKEPRFYPSLLLLDHGAASGVSVTIRGRSRPFGVLGAYSKEPREFSEHEVHFLQSTSNVLAMAVERFDLESELVAISNREQLRIGQDIHDGLCQQLAGIQYAAELVAKKMSSKDGFKAEIAKLADRTREAIRQARSLARGLSLVSLEAQGLMSALEELTSSAQAFFQIRCALECKHGVLINDNTLATHLYRIAREAIHNAVKHGHAKHVTVTLDNTTLSVVDDGTSLMLDWDKTTGMGLRIMRYRAGIIGGTFSIDPVEPSGTQVVCKFKS